MPFRFGTTSARCVSFWVRMVTLIIRTQGKINSYNKDREIRTWKLRILLNSGWMNDVVSITWMWKKQTCTIIGMITKICSKYNQASSNKLRWLKCSIHILELWKSWSVELSKAVSFSSIVLIQIGIWRKR